MRILTLSVLTCSTIFLILTGSSFSGEPTIIPWPVGYSEPDMHNSRDLWRTYGNINGLWEVVSGNNAGNFHPGIDIANNTESSDACDQVRCVKAGYVTHIYSEDVPGSDVNDHLVVICDEMSASADYGWCYQHLTDPAMIIDQYVGYGQHIADMHPEVGQPHLHFMWTYDDYVLCHCLVNPLNYLNPAPLESEDFIWTWNPEGNDPPYEYFFLPYMWYEDWGNLSVSETFDAMLDESDLSGHVDFFLGQYLSGIGMATGLDQAPWLAPRRIKWDVVREKPSGEEIVQTKYVMDFDCVLGGPGDSRFQMHYFRHYMDDMYGQGIDHYGSLSCLTNCGDSTGWENLGIDNILNSSWKTNYDCIDEDDTLNPVLAAFQDGPYRIDVESYTYDLNDMYPVEIDVELHNFDPVVQEVIITGNTDEVVWHALWVANETLDDLVPELMILTNNSVAPDQTLDATVIFAEPMNTSSGTYSITAGKAPGYNDLIVTTTGWSCTNNPEPYYDTWNGAIVIPAEGYSGWISLKVEAEDPDENTLKDPAGAFGDDEYSDLYHGFGISFGPEEGWLSVLHDYVCSSAVLADMDDDGDLDVAFQDSEGWVHILDDDGSSLDEELWPRESGPWKPQYPSEIYASPSVVDLDGDGDLDILSVNPCGCMAWDISTGADLEGWPAYPNLPSCPAKYPARSSPAIGDVDGDGFPEVVFCCHLTDPEITLNKCTVFLLEHTGDCTWHRNLEPLMDGSSVIITPAVGDVSSSHAGMEIVVCTAEGFEVGDGTEEGKDFNSAVYLLDPSDGSDIWKSSFFNTYFYASPVVADIDGDGTNEVIVGSSFMGTDKNMVFVLDGNTGILEHTWDAGGPVMGPVAICDLDGNGDLDVVVSVNGGIVQCWSGVSHQSLEGFPVTVNGNPSKGPSIADIDSDFELEIVVGTYNGWLYAINSDGSICTGFPIEIGSIIEGQIAIGELDGDGHLELVFASGTASDPSAYCYDMGEGSFPAFTPWRQFQHDSWHSGFYEVDNTIPAPPTNLTGEITYPPEGHFIVDLEWELSVNDPLSSNPQDPADVVFYCIYMQFPPYTPFWVVGRTQAGDNTFTHEFTAGYPKVRYFVTAHDGTNESAQSNDICFHTSGKDNLALGCSVYEEFSGQADVPSGISIQVDEQRTEPEIVQETFPTISLEDTGGRIPALTASHEGNPGCLTDGDISAAYTSSQGALCVVIDLGEVCSVSFVDLVNSSPAVSETISPVIEYSAEGARYTGLSLMDEGSYSARYIRITGAENASEVLVYGERDTDSTSEKMTVSSHENVWSFVIPEIEGNPEGELRIYDVSGRLVWNERVDVSEELYWSGFRNDGTIVPSGLYLVHLTVSSDVFTSSLVVNR